jgi:hypothetical protein
MISKSALSQSVEIGVSEGVGVTDGVFEMLGVVDGVGVVLSHVVVAVSTIPN